MPERLHSVDLTPTRPYGSPPRSLASYELALTNRRNTESALRDMLVRGEARNITKYRKNQIIFSQGEPASTVHRILKGTVKVSVVSDSGKEAVVSLLGPGDFFGEDCIAGQTVRISTVSAMTESIIVRIGRIEMLRLLHEQAAFSEMFMNHILKRTMRVQADLVDQLFNSSERRLARLLLLLANYGQDGIPVPIIEKISQETLAKMIGTTRSRVSHFMNKFRKSGFISYNRYIEVHKSLLNSVLHEKTTDRKMSRALPF